MKKYVISILLIIKINLILCQTSFLDSNTIWNVNFINSNGNPIDEILYGIKDDTLINDTLYQKLYLLSDTTLSDNNLKTILGYLRQEGQKIWFKPLYWSSNDILLYDFSVTEGDTVWHSGNLYFMYNGEHSFDNGITYSIIQEVIENDTYKEYSIIRVDGLPDVWYKDIGSKFGLFGSIIKFPLIGDTYNLACVKHNDTIEYINNLFCNKCFCSGLTKIDNKKYDDNFVFVFPVPAENSLTIKIEKPYSKIKIEIIDEKNSIIYTKEELENPINFVDNLSGIFLIQLTIDNETIIKKIILK